MITRVSSVSPRDARNRPDSVPNPERDWTVVSSTTASRVMFWTLPPTGGQSTEHTPELSRFSEQDANETNRSAVTSARTSKDEDFTYNLPRDWFSTKACGSSSESVHEASFPSRV